MSSKIESKRIIYYDYIRAFAIFGVLACHCFAMLVVDVNIFNTKLWYYALFLNSLRDVCVPLFVTISGALLITKKYPIIVFIKKRFNKVIVPYVFWIIMFIIFEIMIWKINDPFTFILNTISIPPVGRPVLFWFVQMLIVVYIMIIILNKLVEYREWILKLSLLLSILFVALLHFNIIPSYGFPLNYFYFFIFAVFGYYLSSYDFTDNKLSKSLKITNEKLVAVFFILSIILYIMEVYFNAVSSISLNSYVSVPQFGLLNIALVISVFLFFRYFSESKGTFNKIFNSITKSKIGKLILSLSFCSYGIYLCHVIIRDFIRNLSIANSLSPSIFYTLLLVLTLIGSWLIIVVMEKIPILNRFSGV